MRAAQLPESLSISRSGASHLIVTAANTSDSFRLFQSRHAHARQGSTPTYVPQSKASMASTSSPVFHLAHLTAPEWSLLLRACRTHTDPALAINYSSPGDVSSAAAAPASRASHTGSQNKAFVHIVERRPGDFVPNNMIYHALQQYTTAGGDAEVEARNAAFNRFMSTLQASTSTSENDVPAMKADAESKRMRDPLAQVLAAQTHSESNRRIRPLCSAVPNTQTGAPCDMFSFYPHPVHVDTSIPYRSAHFCVMVNLKPIVPRHLMVVPLRCVGTIHGLTEEEVVDWGKVMALTVRALDVAARIDQKQSLEESLAAPASDGNYSVAIQQGAEAGQTVPHLHTHIIPFDPHGKLAGEPESDEQEQQRRTPRTAAMMAEETRFFAAIFERLTV